jgi:hypothetical protein
VAVKAKFVSSFKMVERQLQSSINPEGMGLTSCNFCRWLYCSVIDTVSLIQFLKGCDDYQSSSIDISLQVGRRVAHGMV